MGKKGISFNKIYLKKKTRSTCVVYGNDDWRMLEKTVQLMFLCVFYHGDLNIYIYIYTYKNKI